MIIRPVVKNNVNTYSNQNTSNSASRQELRHVSRSNSQSDSVNFTGNASSLFGTYFWADFLAIVAACGIVDGAVALYHTNTDKRIKHTDFINVMKFDHPEELEKVKELTSSIVKNSSNSQINNKIQNDYQRIFHSKLDLANAPEEKIDTKEKYQELRTLLKETTVDKMQNKEAYAEIVVPFLADVSKSVDKN